MPAPINRATDDRPDRPGGRSRAQRARSRPDRADHKRPDHQRHHHHHSDDQHDLQDALPARLLLLGGLLSLFADLGPLVVQRPAQPLLERGQRLAEGRVHVLVDLVKRLLGAILDLLECLGSGLLNLADLVGVALLHLAVGRLHPALDLGDLGGQLLHQPVCQRAGLLPRADHRQHHLAALLHQLLGGRRDALLHLSLEARQPAFDLAHRAAEGRADRIRVRDSHIGQRARHGPQRALQPAHRLGHALLECRDGALSGLLQCGELLLTHSLERLELARLLLGQALEGALESLVERLGKLGLGLLGLLAQPVRRSLDLLEDCLVLADRVVDGIAWPCGLGGGALALPLVGSRAGHWVCRSRFG